MPRCMSHDSPEATITIAVMSRPQCRWGGAACCRLRGCLCHGLGDVGCSGELPMSSQIERVHRSPLVEGDGSGGDPVRRAVPDVIAMPRCAASLRMAVTFAALSSSARHRPRRRQWFSDLSAACAETTCRPPS